LEAKVRQQALGARIDESGPGGTQIVQSLLGEVQGIVEGECSQLRLQVEVLKERVDSEVQVAGSSTNSDSRALWEEVKKMKRDQSQQEEIWIEAVNADQTQLKETLQREIGDMRVELQAELAGTRKDLEKVWSSVSGSMGDGEELAQVKSQVTQFAQMLEDYESVKAKLAAEQKRRGQLRNDVDNFEADMSEMKEKVQFLEQSKQDDFQDVREYVDEKCSGFEEECRGYIEQTRMHADMVERRATQMHQRMESFRNDAEDEPRRPSLRDQLAAAGGEEGEARGGPQHYPISTPNPLDDLRRGPGGESVAFDSLRKECAQHFKVYQNDKETFEEELVGFQAERKQQH